jgi:hypothetical protein
MKRLFFYLVVATASFSTACSKGQMNSNPRPTFVEDGFERAITSFAGNNATDCGRAKTEISGATECVFRAFHEKHAFRVRYDFPGKDSDLAEGLAGNSEGVVRWFSFDGDPYGGDVANTTTSQ